MPAVTTSYDQATQADRVIRIAALSRDGFNFSYSPNTGTIPATWNILGYWQLGSRSGDPFGEYLYGVFYANDLMWVTERLLGQYVDTSATNLDVFRVRFLPYIPSGAVTVNTPGTITP